MAHPLDFEVNGELLRCTIRASYNAGYTGRVRESVEAHISELAQQGVQAPNNLPTLFSVPTYMNLQVDTIDVAHQKTSGEVEWALIYRGPDFSPLLTVASDHTDRALESKDVTASKQIVPNVLGDKAWNLEEIAGQLDDVAMRSHVFRSDEWVLLQEGTIRDLISPLEWKTRLKGLNRLHSGTVLLGGTVPMVSPTEQFAERWEVSLSRPDGESIKKTYDLQYMATSIT